MQKLLFFDPGDVSQSDSQLTKFHNKYNTAWTTVCMYLVKEQVFESGERTLCIDFSTFEEDVAISLEVVARRARSQTKAVLADAVDKTSASLRIIKLRMRI